MQDDEAAARRYRDRAEELRTIAAAMSDAPTRQILIEAADDYDAMSIRRENSAKAEAAHIIIPAQPAATAK